MITEDYVSFETAKLLKEKGFDWLESPFYSDQDRDEWRQNNSYTVPNEEYNHELPFDSETLTMVAPHVSIQMAMKWLREVKHIPIEILWHYDVDSDVEEWYFIHHAELRILPNDIEYYETYEKACEAGIKYCLENLI